MKKATRKALMKSIVYWREYLVKSIGGELVYPFKHMIAEMAEYLRWVEERKK